MTLKKNGQPRKNPIVTRILKVLNEGGTLGGDYNSATLMDVNDRVLGRYTRPTIEGLRAAGKLFPHETDGGVEYKTTPPDPDQPQDDGPEGNVPAKPPEPVTAAEMRSVVALLREWECSTTAAFRDELKFYETLHERVTLLGGADRVREVLAEMDSYSELVREVRNSLPAGGD